MILNQELLNDRSHTTRTYCTTTLTVIRYDNVRSNQRKIVSYFLKTCCIFSSFYTVFDFQGSKLGHTSFLIKPLQKFRCFFFRIRNDLLPSHTGVPNGIIFTNPPNVIHIKAFTYNRSIHTHHPHFLTRLLVDISTNPYIPPLW